MVSSQTQTDLSGQYHMDSIESDIQYENETVCIVQAMWCVTIVGFV